MKKIKCFGKINIALYVEKKFGKKHQIMTIMVPYLKVNDLMLIDINIIKGNQNYVRIKYEDKLLDNSKLLEAIHLFKKETKLQFRIGVFLKKGIKPLSGLGSSASAIGNLLSYLNRYFNFPISNERLEEIGLHLGSDVPFFFDKSIKMQHLLGNYEILKTKLKFNFQVKEFGNKRSTKEVFNKFTKINTNSDKKILELREHIINNKMPDHSFYINDLFYAFRELNPNLHIPLNYHLSGAGNSFFKI